MADHPSDPLNTGLVYEDLLPLHWSVVDVSMDAAHRLHLHEANEDTLRTLSMLEEHPQEIADDHPAVTHELRRLDFKLNLLLDLVGLLVARDLTLPDRVPVRLAAQGLEWEARQPPPRDSLVRLEIYLSPKLPRALVLLGRVQGAHPMSDGVFRTAVIFEDLSELEADWLEKIIFVHHRRQVAHARRTPH
jgi:hypothetical protein